MESPTIRPGATLGERVEPDLFAFFRDAAAGNAAIQLVTALGVAEERLGVTPPELIPGGHGLLLALACPPGLRPRIEAACRTFGAELHRALPR